MRRVFVFIAIGMGSGAVAGDLAEMDTFGWWIGAVTAFLLAAASSVLMKHSRGKCFIRTGMALCAFFIGGHAFAVICSRGRCTGDPACRTA